MQLLQGLCDTAYQEQFPPLQFGLQVSGTSLFRLDHTKQAIVYKLLPQFKPDNEKDMQEQFYRAGASSAGLER